MAKGSVRKKGKKWYYRFYVENESGNLVQKEYAGTESKSETEKLLRKAMEDYEEKKFVAKTENITLGEMLDIWLEEEVKPGTLSTGTLIAYTTTARQIKKHPIGQRKLKSITADHLQEYIDFLSFGGTRPDGTEAQPISKNYMLQFSAVLRGSFRFAVFPKRYITFNPMQYVRMRIKKKEVELFEGNAENETDIPTITHEQYTEITDYLRKKRNPALLPVQIAYYTGLRIGEVCGLAWQDINLEEQYLTVRRSMRYNATRHKMEIGATKRKKIRTVDFCDTLAEILKKARKQQHRERFQCGEMYFRNYYQKVMEKGRTHYDLYSLQSTEEIPDDYEELSFTSNLLSNGAAPKDVQASPIIENEKFIKEGYTADGIKYSIYELIIPDNETVSRIAVSKWVSIVVYYDGDVIPSSTYPYEAYDNEYKTVMKGTLRRTSYEYLLFGNRTRTVYQGTVHGNI